MLTIDDNFFARGITLKNTRVKTNSTRSAMPRSTIVKTNFAKGNTWEHWS